MGRLTDGRGRTLPRDIPIGLFFIKYFIYIFAGIVLTVIALVCAFGLLLNSGVVYPAGYAEEQAKAAVEAIRKAEQVTPDLIPELCQYVVFDEEGHVLSGSMGAREASRAWNVITGREYNGGTYIGADYFLEIPRGAECCVLRYQLIVQYRSAALRRCLPQPEILLLVTFLVLVLGIILSAAVRFHMVFRDKLAPLADAADKIRRQELDFTISHGTVREINAILYAMDEMKTALRDSLEKQWRMEQTKREQMAALAHDLKTPLTLVRGNAELLADTGLTEEQREYTAGIADGALQMQDYVQTMIAVVRSSVFMPANRIQTDAAALPEMFRRQAEGLCAVHHVELQWRCADLAGRIYAEPQQLVRAFMNLLANAAEHTPAGGSVLFEENQDETHVIFTVTDSGKGVTERALRHAKEQFYMDDDSRSAAGSHYGMGLYIVDAIVRQHGGELLLENVPASSLAESRGSEAEGRGRLRGARVTVKLPRQ